MESTTHESGPISEIKSLLDKENIIYDPKTIEILRAIYRLRSTTFPIHETGFEIIPSLQKLNISYPIEDYKSAAYQNVAKSKLLLVGNETIVQGQLIPSFSAQPPYGSHSRIIDN